MTTGLVMALLDLQALPVARESARHAASTLTVTTCGAPTPSFLSATFCQ